MRLLLAIGDGQPLRFTIRGSDGQGFVISSFLVVDREGQPVWEFVRTDFEPCEMEEVHEVNFVLTEEFRQMLQAAELPRRIPQGFRAAGTYEVNYGVVPEGYKQSIPLDHRAPSLSIGGYRAIVFSSINSASAAFDIA